MLRPEASPGNASPADLPYLTLANCRCSANRPIVILSSSLLTPTTPAPPALSVTHFLHPLGASTALTLLYIHSPASTVSTASARAFRAAWASLPAALHSRVAQVVVLHPTAALRTALYVLSARADYAKIVLCDLVEDVEQTLGIDALLLDLAPDVLEADEVNREWVGRSLRPAPPALDPRKPLLNYDDVDASRSTETPGSLPTFPSAAEARERDGAGV